MVPRQGPRRPAADGQPHALRDGAARGRAVGRRAARDARLPAVGVRTAAAAARTRRCIGRAAASPASTPCSSRATTCSTRSATRPARSSTVTSCLSRALATAGHFPRIDVLESISRVGPADHDARTTRGRDRDAPAARRVPRREGPHRDRRVRRGHQPARRPRGRNSEKQWMASSDRTCTTSPPHRMRGHGSIVSSEERPDEDASASGSNRYCACGSVQEDTRACRAARREPRRARRRRHASKPGSTSTRPALRHRPAVVRRLRTCAVPARQRGRRRRTSRATRIATRSSSSTTDAPSGPRPGGASPPSNGSRPVAATSTRSSCAAPKTAWSTTSSSPATPEELAMTVSARRRLHRPSRYRPNRPHPAPPAPRIRPRASPARAARTTARARPRQAARPTRRPRPATRSRASTTHRDPRRRTARVTRHRRAGKPAQLDRTPPSPRCSRR